MNPKIYSRAIEISRALKNKKNGRSFHACFLYRKSKIVAIGVNDYSKPHNSNRFGQYQNHKGYGTEYRASKHAEISAVIRHGEENLDDCEMLVVRLNKDGKPCLSRPCQNCSTVLAGLNLKRIFYSDSSGEITRDERF